MSKNQSKRPILLYVFLALGVIIIIAGVVIALTNSPH